VVDVHRVDLEAGEGDERPHDRRADGFGVPILDEAREADGGIQVRA
jgi:hypothetical protein